MTPSQRAAAERLIKARNVLFTHKAVVEWADHAEALLRELLAEPVHESKPTTASQFESVKQAKRAAEYELRYYTKMMKEKNAAPQQPMRCPEDGGACGAGGYCRPEPVQRRPLTDKEIIALPAWDDYMGGCITLLDFARAVEKAHGITGEQK